MNGRELHWLTTISVVRHIQTLLPRSINIKGLLAPLVNHLREICFSSSHNLGQRKNSESPSSFMWSLRFTSSTSTRRRVVSEFTGYLWEEAGSRNEWWNAAHKRLEMYRAKRAAMKQTQPPPPPRQSHSCLAKAKPKLIVLAPDKQTLRGYVIFRKLKVQLQ